MKADINPKELGRLLVLLTKDVRGKKAREKARAIFFFKGASVEVEFNDMSTSCPAEVKEDGAYVLNPYVLRDVLDTFSDKRITVEIDDMGARIGKLRIAHSRLRGVLHRPEKALRLWQQYWDKQLAKKQRKIERENESKNKDQLPNDELWTGRRVDFRLPNGEIERGAVISNYERGVPGNRKVLVKTKDFQEVWISELEIVNFDLEPQLDV